MSSPHYYTVFQQSSGRGRVLGCPVADNNAAVGDAGPVPAFPELGVLAPVLKKDVADAGRVIREGVGDLRREQVTIETGHGEDNLVLQNNCSLFLSSLALGKVSVGPGRQSLTSFHAASFHCSMVTGGGSKEAKTI